MDQYPNREERRGHSEPQEWLDPQPLIYSKDPWDVRRFRPFRRRRGAEMSGWEAASPFIFIAAVFLFLALVVIGVHLVAR